MMVMAQQNKPKLRQPSSQHGSRKFFILLIILTVYAVYVMLNYGVRDGLGVTFLTWAFFVTCTPIADAGFVIDFPVRVLLGFKMIFAEISVWVLAGVIMAYYLIFEPTIFATEPILQLFHTILLHPWPLWSIIAISAAGTFLSIYIGDQIYTLVQRYQRHQHIKKLQLQRVIIESTVLVIVIVLYFMLLSLTNIEIS